eukprot:3449971-Rhodomonas_salina.2
MSGTGMQCPTPCLCVVCVSVPVVCARMWGWYGSRWMRLSRTANNQAESGLSLPPSLPPALSSSFPPCTHYTCADQTAQYVCVRRTVQYVCVRRLQIRQYSACVRVCVCA